jgi:hypothetical protein
MDAISTMFQKLCGLVGRLIVEEDSVYTRPRPNDRLLLGMKGTMSESFQSFR